MKLWNTKPALSDFASDGSGGLVAILPARPPIPSAPPPAPKVDHAHAKYLEEYARLAELTGVKPLVNEIEKFRAFLVANDITVFSLSEVVAYMTEKAKTEGIEGAGWLWRPLRAKDQRGEIGFGAEAYRWENGVRPAADFYRGAHKAKYYNGQGQSEHEVSASATPYDRTIPLHALRKVALIESKFKGDVALFVSDYAPLPAISYPDPFLMAIVPNPDLRLGTGRFVIDFWDEPGFGLDKQLA